MSDNRESVAPQGALTVEHVGQLKSELAVRFRNDDAVELELGSVSQIDVAGITVLYAASREASACGKELRLSGTLHSAVREALELGGFCEEAPLDAKELPGRLLDFEIAVSEGSNDG